MPRVTDHGLTKIVMPARHVDDLPLALREWLSMCCGPTMPKGGKLTFEIPNYLVEEFRGLCAVHGIGPEALTG